MRAKIKSTGEIVDVLRYGYDGSYTIYVDSKGKEVNDCTLSFLDDFETDFIDWEQRRYEVAKEILANFAISNELRVLQCGSEQRVKWAIEEADELIKQLKGE